EIVPDLPATTRWRRGWHLQRMTYRVTSGEVDDGVIAKRRFDDDVNVVFVVDNRASQEEVLRLFPRAFEDAVREEIFRNTRQTAVGPFVRYSFGGQFAAFAATALGTVFPSLGGHMMTGGHPGRLPVSAVARAIKVGSDGTVQPWNSIDRRSVRALNKQIQARFSGLPSANRIAFVSRQVARLHERNVRAIEVAHRFDELRRGSSAAVPG